MGPNYLGSVQKRIALKLTKKNNNCENNSGFRGSCVLELLFGNNSWAHCLCVAS